LGTKAAIHTVHLLTCQPAQLPSGSANDFTAVAVFLASAKQYLQGLNEDHFRGCEDKEFHLESENGGETVCNAMELVFSHTYPIFYYHAVSAHAALLHLGVSIKRWEFFNPPG
jgi:hypothetical protein